MLRPTLAEILSGIQRTILGTMFAELTSPYAQGQAAMAATDLTHVVSSLEKAPAYDAAEVADLKRTFTALKPLAAKLPPALHRTVTNAITAAEASNPDRRAMEAAISDLAAALALNKLEASIAEPVRAYLRRYLERTRTLLQSQWGA